MASLFGVVGTLAIIVAVLGFLILSFIGSSAAASSSVRSALSREDVRGAVAESLVDKLEEGGNTGVRIIIRVARNKVVDAVVISLSNDKLRDIAGDAAATAYGVFVERKPRAMVDIQMFADAAFKAIRSADPFIPQVLSPQVDPIEISRDEGSPDYADIVTLMRIATWALLIGGLVLLTISMFMSVVGNWLRVRRIGTRFIAGGLSLIVLSYLAPIITPADDRNGRLAEALVSFAASRLLTWSIIITAIALVVTMLSAVMNRIVTSKSTACA